MQRYLEQRGWIVQQSSNQHWSIHTETDSQTSTPAASTQTVSHPLDIHGLSSICFLHFPRWHWDVLSSKRKLLKVHPQLRRPTVGSSELWLNHPRMNKRSPGHWEAKIVSNSNPTRSAAALLYVSLITLKLKCQIYELSISTSSLSWLHFIKR